MKQQSPLSKKTQEIILGSLLGDGSLKIHPQYANARFSFRHSYRQKDYFFWKVERLKEISSDNCYWVQGQDGKDGWGGKKLRYQSKALPVLTDLYKLTHKRKTKRVRRRWLNKLSPLSLAIWWMDDGSLVSDSRQGVFCTDSFTKEEVKLIQRYLKVVWKVSTAIGQVGTLERYRLWLQSTEELQKFLRIILPHIPVLNMLPKAIMLYKDANLQQRWISEIIELTDFSESEVRSAVKLKRSKWRKFRE